MRDKLYLYARVSEGVQSVYFYYYPVFELPVLVVVLRLTIRTGEFLCNQQTLSVKLSLYHYCEL